MRDRLFALLHTSLVKFSLLCSILCRNTKTVDLFGKGFNVDQIKLCIIVLRFEISRIKTKCLEITFLCFIVVLQCPVSVGKIEPQDLIVRIFGNRLLKTCLCLTNSLQVNQQTDLKS